MLAVKNNIMGCIFSHLYSLVFGNVDDAKAISKKIDKQILQELKNEPDEIDILILGAQEAGKSTLLKQVCSKNPSIYNILRWVAWTMGQMNHRPRV